MRGIFFILGLNDFISAASWNNNNRISADCVSGSETLFAEQSQILKLNMLRAFHGLTVSLPLCVNVAFLQTHVHGKNVREKPSTKFIMETSAFTVSHASSSDGRNDYFFSLSRGNMELQVWQRALIIWVASQKHTPGFKHRGALEWDTREKEVGSPWSQTQRIWPVFKMKQLGDAGVEVWGVAGVSWWCQTITKCLPKWKLTKGHKDFSK